MVTSNTSKKKEKTRRRKFFSPQYIEEIFTFFPLTQKGKRGKKKSGV